MAAMRPDQVVDHSKRRTDLNVGCVVVKPDETARAYCERKCASLGIVKWRTIDVELGFIEKTRSECVLQRDQIICRVVEGLKFVRRETAPIRRVDQADVALGTAVDLSLLVELVVNPY